MYFCLECECIFETLKHYIEKHNLDTPPYEEFDACPNCGGAYVLTYPCDCCGEWITTEDYVKTNNGERFCESCFKYMKLGDED